MDSAYVLLGIGMICFGGALMAEGARRSGLTRMQTRPPSARRRPPHQESGYTHPGWRGRIEQYWQGRRRTAHERPSPAGLAYSIIGGLFIAGGVAIEVVAILRLSR